MTSRHDWTSKLGHVTWLSGALFALMATNDDNGCQPQQAANTDAPQCQVASDCKGDPGIDCVGAWACDSGQCQFECGHVPPPQTGCYSDSDCADGLVCDAATVCHAPPGCERGQDCAAVCYGECVQPQPQPTKCTSSEQCPAGDYCTTESGACDSNCPPGESCPAVCWGDCAPKTNGSVCYADSDCATGQFCDRDPCVFPDASGAASDKMIACGGVCADRQACNGPQDCPAGQSCGCAPYPAGTPSNGLVPCFLQCLPNNPACATDSDCAAGQVCQNGACTDARTQCQTNDQCPAGWACQSECDAGFAATPDSNGDSGGAARPACLSYCVPQGGTCADTGETCPAGETCVNDCYTVCPDCNCPNDDPSCTCGSCYDDCRSSCVPDQGSCDPAQCPAGTHCGCPGDVPMPANGLIACDQKCVPDQATCTSDADCGDGNFCQMRGDCGGAPVPCDPSSGQSCDMPIQPPPSCTGVCAPKTPDYDCKGDDNCIAADGTQGFCKFDVCEANGGACPPDSDRPCDPPPPAVCYGWCVYPTGPTTCDPNAADSCPPGNHCEATGGCGGAGSGMMPCYMQYQCVPDEEKCETDCDCDPSLACNDGVCERMGRVNTCGMSDCTSDAECPDGDYCKIDPNQPVCDCVGCGCSVPHGTCEPKAIETCLEDSDCPAGDVCQCGADPSCPMCDHCIFQCVPKPDPGNCQSDADCGDGQECHMYYPPCAAPDPSFAVPPACGPYGVCEDKPSKCQVTGCSGTVCSDHPVITTCEWFDYYQCYRYAICDVGGDGTCGWQKTDDFVACMEKYGQQ